MTGRPTRLRGRGRHSRGRLVLITSLAVLALVAPGSAASADTTSVVDVVAQPSGTGLGTGGVREWILSNLIPLLLLVVALLLLWLGGGKGDNPGVMKRLGGVIVALAIVGLAVTTDAGRNIGVWLAGLFSG